MYTSFFLCLCHEFFWVLRTQFYGGCNGPGALRCLDLVLELPAGRQWRWGTSAARLTCAWSLRGQRAVSLPPGWGLDPVSTPHLKCSLYTFTHTATPLHTWRYWSHRVPPFCFEFPGSSVAVFATSSLEVFLGYCVFTLINFTVCCTCWICLFVGPDSLICNERTCDKSL